MTAMPLSTLSWLFTPAQSRALIANWETNEQRQAAGRDPVDFMPVVSFLLTGTPVHWLLTEANPRTRLAYGLANMGGGRAQLGFFELDMLEAMARAHRHRLTREENFTPRFGLDKYHALARQRLSA